MSEPEDLNKKSKRILAIFTSLVSVAQSALAISNVPFAADALETVSKIIELAESVKSNKEDCMSLASRCLDLLSAISKAIDSQNSKAANKILEDNAKNLEKTLISVKATMSSLKEMNRFFRTVQYRDIKDRIKRQNSALDQALDLFSVKTIIEMNLTINRMDENINRILDKVEGGMRTVENNTTDLYLLEREPPSKPDIFYGRNDYVAKVVNNIMISDHPVRLSILGIGGIGKTSVASAIIDDSAIRQNFVQHRYFIKCTTFISADEMLRAMCQIIMGSDSLKSDNKNILGALLQFLKNAPKVLVILDNFETVWNAEFQQDTGKILNGLFQLSHLTIIITMRGDRAPDNFGWTHGNHETLLALDIESAKKTYRSTCNSYEDSAENDSDLADLLHQLDCVPLAVFIVAKMADVEGATPKQISRNLKEYLEAERNDAKYSIKASVELSLNSYVIRNNPECMEVLLIIASLPGGVSSESIREMTNHSNPIRLIAALLTAGLIHKEGKRFNMLSPIRLYIEQEYPLEPNTQQAIFEFYFRICADGRDASDSLEKKARLSAEKANCLKVLSDAIKLYKADNRHLEAIINFSWFLYYTIPSSELLQLASKEFQACIDKFLVARYYNILGEIFRLRNNYKEAKEALANAKLQFGDNGDRTNEADCLQRLGDIAYMEADYEEARRMLLEAKDIFDIIDERLGAANCLQSLGEVARMQADYKKARSTFSEAKGLFENIGDRRGVASCVQSLGDVAVGQKDYEEASSMLLEAKAIYDSIDERRGAAQCLRSLGLSARVQKKYEEAKRILSEAKDMSVSVGDRLGEAQCIEYLGHTAMDCGEYKDAKQMLLEAKSTYEVIGVPRALAQCQRNLDELMRRMGESVS